MLFRSNNQIYFVESKALNLKIDPSKKRDEMKIELDIKEGTLGNKYFDSFLTKAQVTQTGTLRFLDATIRKDNDSQNHILQELL